MAREGPHRERSTRRDALLIASGESARGTRTETELLDLIDGVIVDLVRLARRAGRSASRETGQKRYAVELELNELYKNTGRRKPVVVAEG